MPKEQRERDDGGERLPKHLLAGRNAVAVAMHDLQVIITVADRCERGIHKQRDENPDIGAGPEHRTQKDTTEDQQTTHRRRVLFVEALREVAGAIVVVVLAELEPLQLTDQPRSDNEPDQRRRPRRADGAHRNVAQHAERAEVFGKIGEEAKHGRSPTRAKARARAPAPVDNADCP